MGVSLSTTPSLIPTAPQPSSNPRHALHAGTIRCNRIECDGADEDRFRRRDVLKCVGATLSMELLGSSGPSVEMAAAADLIQRRQRSEFLSDVKGTLFKAIKGKPDIIPSLLTLALNDAMTYDKFVGYKIWGPKWINTIQEEFEAPMWVDLTLEAKANDQDIDDKWFHISHPFHRCSSRQLKSAFSHSGEESENLDFNLYGPSSPKLPSSVSRSRGKHHMSGNWGKENGGFSINKQHPVKSLSGETSWIQ